MTEPTTAAGRALLAEQGRIYLFHPVDGRRDILVRHILKIEREAEARSDATAPRDAAPLTTIVEELRLIRAGFDHWEHDDERGHMEGDPEIVVLGRKHIPFLDQAIALLSAAPPDPAPTAPRDAAPHQPGDFHQYRTQCEICGEFGTVQLSLLPDKFEGTEQ